MTFCLFDDFRVFFDFLRFHLSPQNSYYGSPPSRSVYTHWYMSTKISDAHAHMLPQTKCFSGIKYIKELTLRAIPTIFYISSFFLGDTPMNLGSGFFFLFFSEDVMISSRKKRKQNRFEWSQKKSQSQWR